MCCLLDMYVSLYFVYMHVVHTPTCLAVYVRYAGLRSAWLLTDMYLPILVCVFHRPCVLVQSMMCMFWGSTTTTTTTTRRTGRIPLLFLNFLISKQDAGGRYGAAVCVRGDGGVLRVVLHPPHRPRKGMWCIICTCSMT